MFEKTKYCVNLDFSKLKMYIEFSESVLGESRALVFEGEIKLKLIIF